MNKSIKGIVKGTAMLLLTLILFIAAFATTYFMVQMWPTIHNWWLGERFIFNKQLITSQLFWPSLYKARVAVLTLVLFTGFATITIIAGKLLGKLLAYLPRTYLYVLFSTAFFYLFLVLLLSLANFQYGTFKGPGNTTLFYGPAPVLTVNQMYIADSTGMNHFAASQQYLYGTQKINPQGFVGPFDYTTQFCDAVKKAGKKLVFIIGDSFVEGVSDGHYNTVFIERLRQADTTTLFLNFGIGGADPLSYKLVAEKYVPLLKPDLVLIAFCWNDVMYADRIATPYIPMYYQTNIGWFSSNVPYSFSGKPNVILPSADSAFNYYKSWYFIDPAESKLAWLCSKNPLAAKAYTSDKRLPDYRDPNTEKYITTVSHKHIKAIDSICIANGTKMSIAFIPDIAKADTIQTLAQNHSEYKHVFHEYLPRVHFIQNTITRADYISDHNQHFNEGGNAKYATFLQQVIQQELKGQ